ncbi:hypothetical protein D8Y22_12415 [Salinadaptatus halalkaliphilus]|uniref:DUF4129 domain-containing protein n=2 Tax=Salinadaptatus halalkaliphilus TaxID=2419781 RepID=A0A4S3TK24_9EURY|nr:hypothetical protein D8Y22_12415 [Salinadaptatus halalkaliphilus]
MTVGAGTNTPNGDFQTAIDDSSGENETILHQDPETIAEDGDLAAVDAWLLDRLNELLADRSNALADGEYDRATEYGEEYQLRLEQLDDVSAYADTDERVALYEQLGLEQTELHERLETYDDLEAEYEAARDAGDDERARELARDLSDLSETISETTTSLEETYEIASDAPGVNMRDERRTARAIDEAIVDADETRTQEFDATELTVEANEEISFLEPLEGEGNLTTADGDPIGNGSLELIVANERIEAELENGTVEFEYRPTDLPLRTDSVPIEYAPSPSSTYAGSETSVPVSIQQVEPTLSITESPTALAYNDTVAIEAELEADGESIDDVPIDAAVDETEIGTEQTSNGSVTIEYTVPSDIPDGEGDLVVDVPYEDQAIAGVESQVVIDVLETETDLELELEHETGRELAVNGTLSSDDGDGVGGQTVELFVDGDSVGAATTQSTGDFSEPVVVPDDAGSGMVEVTALYDGAETNLADETTTSSVRLPSEPVIDTTALADRWLEIAVLSLVVLLAVLYRWRHRRREPTAEYPGEQSPATDDDTVSIAVEPMVVHAATQLSNGRANAAVQTCYGAVSDVLGDQISASQSPTPRELLHAGTTDDSFTRSDQLRSVVDGYERATYRQTDVSLEEAERILEQTMDLCGIDDSA